MYDVDGAFGGPIKKDKLWFFFLSRTYGNSTSVTGMFANKNAGNPNAWSYVPDPTLQARNDGSTIVNALRLTYQIDQKQKAESVRGFPEGLQRRRVAQLGRKGVPRHARRLDRRRDQHDCARGQRLWQFDAAAHLAGHLHQHADQQDAVRVRLQRLHEPLGRSDRAGQPDQRLHPGAGTGRRDPRSLLSRHQHPLRHRLRDVNGLDLGQHVAREPLVRHRRPQHQVRLQRPLRLRQPGFERRQLAGSRVPVQQRRAESVLGAVGPVQEPVAHPLRCVLRAGFVDARPAHPAGRGALRARVELLSRVLHRRHAFHPLLDDSGSQAAPTSTTSCRESVWPTICSAAAERR